MVTYLFLTSALHRLSCTHLFQEVWLQIALYRSLSVLVLTDDSIFVLQDEVNIDGKPGHVNRQRPIYKKRRVKTIIYRQRIY